MEIIYFTANMEIPATITFQQTRSALKIQLPHPTIPICKL